ncbi:MAG: hypothetical protein UDS46_11295 [Bacteroidales bacterium]|nr:hypothetical protein [Bacteroidales bacterium]
MTVDFMELASYCKQDIELKCSKTDHKFEYDILYAAIQEDDDIKTSRTPHILKEAKQCILIHSWQQLASTIDYDTYLVQCINQNGEVHSDKLDNDYSIHIYPSRYSTCASISLKRGSVSIYESTIWSNGENVLPQKLSYIWNLYKRCKSECKSLEESKLLGKLAQKEQTVNALNSKITDFSIKQQLIEAEVSQYRFLLDEIKKLINNK